jgi:hypothetical protein
LPKGGSNPEGVRHGSGILAPIQLAKNEALDAISNPASSTNHMAIRLLKFNAPR